MDFHIKNQNWAVSIVLLFKSFPLNEYELVLSTYCITVLKDGMLFEDSHSIQSLKSFLNIQILFALFFSAVKGMHIVIEC